MGMYDTVVVEGLKLKTPPEVTSYLKSNNASLSKDFQTKDLENILRTYKIDSKGQIWAHLPVKTGKKIPYTSPLRDWEDNRSLLERLYTKYKYKTSFLHQAPETVDEIKHVWRRQKITNTFDIYTFEEINGRYVDVQFKVEAINGKIKKIELVSGSIEPIGEAKERLLRNQEWDIKLQENIRKHREFTSRWFYPIIKETYNPFIFFSRLGLQKLSNLLSKWALSLRGV